MTKTECRMTNQLRSSNDEQTLVPVTSAVFSGARGRLVLCAEDSAGYRIETESAKRDWSFGNA
jgi:hypothetical protein